jgi:hypothetical protein
MTIAWRSTKAPTSLGCDFPKCPNDAAVIHCVPSQVACEDVVLACADHAPVDSYPVSLSAWLSVDDFSTQAEIVGKVGGIECAKAINARIYGEASGP